MKKNLVVLLIFFLIFSCFSSFQIPNVKASPDYENYNDYTEADPTGAGSESGHIQ